METRYIKSTQYYKHDNSRRSGKLQAHQLQTFSHSRKIARLMRVGVRPIRLWEMEEKSERTNGLFALMQHQLIPLLARHFRAVGGGWSVKKAEMS